MFFLIEISVFSSKTFFSICLFRKFCVHAASRNFQFLILTVTATSLTMLWSKRMFMTLFSKILLFSLIDITASFEISWTSYWFFLSSSIWSDSFFSILNFFLKSSSTVSVLFSNFSASFWINVKLNFFFQRLQFAHLEFWNVSIDFQHMFHQDEFRLILSRHKFF